MVEEAFAKAPRLTQNLLKIVVFRIKAGDWILATVAGNVRIHYKKLADAMGVNRKKTAFQLPRHGRIRVGVSNRRRRPGATEHRLLRQRPQHRDC